MIYGATRPTRGSWITWATLDMVILAGMYASGTVNGQIIGGTLSSAMIMVLACLGWGKPGWTKLEKICLAILPIGLLLWWLTTDPWWSIVISLILLTIGCWPTYESAWIDPTRESKAAWTLMLLSSLFILPTLPAIHTWTIETGVTVAAQPIVFFATQLPMMYLLWIRSYRK